eukprot:6020855-Alexandrium_andersonii.AAC.1
MRKSARCGGPYMPGMRAPSDRATSPDLLRHLHSSFRELSVHSSCPLRQTASSGSLGRRQRVRWVLMRGP